MMESSYALAVEWLQMANELVHEEEMPNVTDSVHLSVLENNLQLSMAIVRDFWLSIIDFLQC